MSEDEKEIVEEEPIAEEPVAEEPVPAEEVPAEEPAPVEEAPPEEEPVPAAEEVVPPPPPPSPPSPPSPPRMVGRYTQDEVTMAAIAHGSALLGLFTSGIGGVIVALIIWLVKKEESAYVGFQALQALVFQIVILLITFIVSSVVWAITVGLMMIAVGLCLLPFAILITLALPLAGLIYGLYGAIECYNGRDFEYWLVADFLKGQSGQV